MNLNIAELAVFAACLLLALYWGRTNLFLLWPITLLVLPTARLYLGFPLYLFDIVIVLLLVLYRRELMGLRWPAGSIPWHNIFLGLIVVCGLVWPSLILQPAPQSVWVSVHAALAYLQISIIALLFSDPRLGRERRLLGYGLAVSVLLLGVIAVLQFGSPDMAGRIARIFYRDIAKEAFVNSDFYAEIAAQRAAGPFGSANILGVVAVLAALAATLLVKARPLLLATLGAATVTTLASVSRQAIIGSVLAGLVYFLMSRQRERSTAALLAIVAAPLFLVGFLASDYSAAVLERFGRWDQGVQQDDNFTARYIDGPVRLAHAVVEFPSILLFGTGPDIRKLTDAGIDTGGRELGFLSIGYLLFLFQFGLLGLFGGLAMLAQAWRRLRFVPSVYRARVAALMTATCTFYLTDNAPNTSESVTMLCFLGIGICGGCAIQAAARQSRRLPVRRRAVRPPAPPIAAH